MQRPNGTQGALHPACASCKHQRKKCDESCILAPFFPAEKNREFQAVHKVFGVSNIQKIIKSLDEKDRKRAADSLVWEAFCRQKDPILGPYGEYSKLSEELKLYKSSVQYYQPPTTEVLGQDGLVYKTPSSYVGWNGTSGITNKGSFGNEVNNNNGLNYNHTNIVNSRPYPYPSKQDGDDSGFIGLQQNSINGYNPPYYLSGIYYSLHSLDASIFFLMLLPPAFTLLPKVDYSFSHFVLVYNGDCRSI